MNKTIEVPAPRLKAFAATFGLGLMLLSAQASAAFIEASASCPGDASCDNSVTDNYGFKFTIADTSDANIFNATLLNTSSTSLSDALIDALAFNMNPTLTLGIDFTIANVTPVWTFEQINNGGVQFDYVGERTSPDTRIGPNQTLTFQFVFNVALPDDPFDLWLTAGSSSGQGLGGGDDSGQVAVSFQQLGLDGEDSDLLTATWTFPEDPEDPEEVPEPGSLALLGLGLAGLAALRRRRLPC